MLTRVLNIFQARLAEAKPPVYVHNETFFPVKSTAIVSFRTSMGTDTFGVGLWVAATAQPHPLHW